MGAAVKPGVYEMAADEYHGHAALSSSGARRILPPGCPALFHYERGNPIETTREMDMGTVAHTLLLGNGADIAVLDFDNYTTKAAREKRDAAAAEGKTPILAYEYVRAQAMVSALTVHPIAKHLFNGGKAEQSLFWVDSASGVDLRARIDYMRLDGDRPLVIDYKSTTSAALDAIPKAIDTYGYHIQAAFYLAGVKALGLADDPAFLNVWQERKPPFLVTVTQMPLISLVIGADRMREAIDIYAACTAANHWPPHSERVEAIGVPYWTENAWRNG